VLLRIEDYALLLGTGGLFVILAAVMYLTRNLDWYAIGRRPVTEVA
jgi:inner membrane protein